MHIFSSLAGLAAGLALLGAADAAPCSATSGAQAPLVVELYTSEGCSSCPPAERWLSGLETRGNVVTLAFHVDYWDNAQWRDRFAQAQFTQRQNASQRTSGARFAYTPQVIVDGRDTPDWPASTAALPASRPAAPVGLALARDDAGLTLTVQPANGAAGAMNGYVAVVDDGLRSTPAGGENRGATLREDAVVRELLPWSAPAGKTTTLRLVPNAKAEPGAPRHWVAVAVDGGRPVQAVSLTCAR